jgi:hypothetical protein
MTECVHSPTGHPYGHPIFPCAWPTCPRGVQAPSWVVAGPHHGIPVGTQYTREKHQEGDTTYYTWSKAA